MNTPNTIIGKFNKIKISLVKPFKSSKSLHKYILKHTEPNFCIIDNPKLIMLLLVKNEDDIIAQNIEFHKSMGVDGFIVTDNNSNDNTCKILQYYKEKGWILDIIHEPSSEYKQANFVNRMIDIAKNKYNADWIISADADEFWRAKSGNLKTELQTSKANLLFVPVYNMLDKGNNWIENTDMIIKHINKYKEKILIKLNKLNKFSQFTVSYPKIIFRANQVLNIWGGNHNADMQEQHKKIVSNDIYIYHFNSRGFDKFKSKIINGGKGLEKNNDLKFGVHWKYFYDKMKNKTFSLNNEYKKSTGTLCFNCIKNLLKKDTFIYDFFKLKEIEKIFPKLLDFEQMLEQIKLGASIVRYGDAEFDIAMQRNKNDLYQKPSDDLSNRLLEILKIKSNDKLIVCIPPFDAKHNNIQNYKQGLSFWKWYWKERWDIIGHLFINESYGNSFFSRDSIFYELSIDKINEIWNDKNVVFVYSPQGRFIFDERLFGNIKSISEIHIPSTNAFSKYDEILNECLQYSNDYLFFIAGGPTATILAYDLYKKGYQALDMGHFSNCYLQYLGEALAPERLPLTKKLA